MTAIKMLQITAIIGALNASVAFADDQTTVDISRRTCHIRECFVAPCPPICDDPPNDPLPPSSCERARQAYKKAYDEAQNSGNGAASRDLFYQAINVCNIERDREAPTSTTDSTPGTSPTVGHIPQTVE